MKTSFFFSIIVCCILFSQTGCKKVIKSVAKETAKEGVKEIAKNADRKSKQSHSNQISDSSLKSLAREANQELNNYRLQCSKYKKIFDGIYTVEQYNNANSEFNIQRNHFYNWLSSKSLRSHSGSTSFASKYNNWLTKYHSYHKSYTDAVIKSQKHCINQLKSHLKSSRTTVSR